MSEVETNSGCLYCRIIAGMEPASIVHEDADSLGILTVRPTREGECLLLAKQHFDGFLALPETLASHLIKKAQLLGHALQTAVSAPAIGLVMNGFAAQHPHLVIVPQREHHDITSQHFVSVVNGMAQFECKQPQPVSRDELDRIAERIRQSLQRIG